MRAEPAGVQALIAQPSVEALDMPILHRSARLDVHHQELGIGPKLTFFRPWRNVLAELVCVR